jgi:translation initiation factor IF-3
VDEHDYQFKKKHIERFLAEGDKVKATVFFRGREMAHPEIGRRILERLIGELTEVAIAESAPRQEGNQMHTILAGKPDKSGKPRPPAPEPARRPAAQTPTAAASVAARPLAGQAVAPPAPTEES